MRAVLRVIRLSSRSPSLRTRAVLGSALVALLAYTAGQNHTLTGDGIAYAVAARDGGDALWHPHHLAYNAMVRVAWRCLGALGHVELLTLMGLASAVAMAVAIALFASLALRWARLRLALAGTALFAFSYGAWFVGTTPEVYAFALAAELGAWVVVVADPRSPRRLAAAALLLATAMLFHQTAVFAALALALFVWRRAGARRALALLGGSGALVVGSYLAVAVGVLGLAPRALPRWMVSYAVDGRWGGGLQPGRWPLAVWGAFKTVACAPTAALRARCFDARTLIALGATAAVLAGGAWLAVALARRPDSRGEPDARAVTVSLGAWLGAQVVFTAWWDQLNPEFWVLALPPALLLLVRRLAQAPLAPRTVERAVALLAGALALVNVWPIAAAADARDTIVPSMARLLPCAELRDGDLILGAAWDVRAYLRYRCGVAVDEDTIQSLRFASAAERAAALAAFAARLDGAHGVSVYLLESELEPERASWLAGFQPLSGPEVRAFYAPWLARAAPLGSYRHDARSWTLYRLWRRR